MARTVYKIPKSIQANKVQPAACQKRKVAAYARVSTDFEEQATSYATQVSYYTGFIKKREDWKFVKVYTDEGITGTSIKHREGFKQMIDDALSGKIDLIITKSISRFARNTVDSLTAIRQLKEKGVEVYFEKENIWTLDGKGEVLLTIMSSLAQEESRSISENVTWSVRKRYAEGQVQIPFSRFLGYDKDFKIIEDQAKTVRHIFSWFLQGYNFSQICRLLEEHQMPTVTGKMNWSSNRIKYILTNEKYKGDALLQKGYSSDFLTKKRVVNNGELPQYYVKEHHEPIIDPDVFDKVQLMLEKKSSRKGGHEFCGKIFCGECGSFYGQKTWHSNTKYRRVIWQCKDKFKSQHETSFLKEEEIQQAFVQATNELIKSKSKLIPVLLKILDETLSTKSLEDENDEIMKAIEQVEEKLNSLLELNTQRAIPPESYDELSETYLKLEERLNSNKAEIADKKTRKWRAEESLRFINESDVVEEYSEERFRLLVESITVYENKELRFKFWDGSEISVTA